MIESRFLSGKVWKRRLPTFSSFPGPDAPLLKRLMLPQGELAQIYDDNQPVHYLAYLEFQEGSVRGNHFHLVKEEFLYVFRGETLLVVEDLESKAREEVSLGEGELAYIPTRVAHALRILKSGQAVEFSQARFDGSDTYRYSLA